MFIFGEKQYVKSRYMNANIYKRVGKKCLDDLLLLPRLLSEHLMNTLLPH